MTTKQPPPLIRLRDIPKYFGQKLSDKQLAKWEEGGVIHPFRPDPSSRALYRSRELDELLNGPKQCQS